jgi:hypothetical protein
MYVCMYTFSNLCDCHFAVFLNTKNSSAPFVCYTSQLFSYVDSKAVLVFVGVKDE